VHGSELALLAVCCKDIGASKSKKAVIKQPMQDARMSLRKYIQRLDEQKKPFGLAN
jgi:hypothetical protein